MKTHLRKLYLFTISVLVLSASMLGQAQTANTASTTAQGWTSTGSQFVTGPMIVTSTSSGIVWSLGSDSPRKASKRPVSAQLVDASAKILPAAKLAPATYLSLARAIDMDGPSTDEARILDAIAKLGLHVYDWERVDDYLQQQAQKQRENTIWGWKPLRAKDRKATESNLTGYVAQVGYLFLRSVYPRTVPAKVLIEAKDILDSVPDAVFLVSDYEVLKPDPFLAITTPRLLDAGKVWVIDRWDEPGFLPELPLFSKQVH